MACMALLAGLFFLSSCSEDVLDMENPSVEIFINQLKSGKLTADAPDATDLMPHFTTDDIAALLTHADDLTEITSFPLAPVSYNAGGKFRLGECVLWVVETIRIGQNASLGCKMVHNDAARYEGIYFLSDEEFLEAVELYRHWWKFRNVPQTMWAIDTCLDDPLCGSSYMWW